MTGTRVHRWYHQHSRGFALHSSVRYNLLAHQLLTNAFICESEDAANDAALGTYVDMLALEFRLQLMKRFTCQILTRIESLTYIAASLAAGSDWSS
jgi:hypothetical protein